MRRFAVLAVCCLGIMPARAAEDLSLKVSADRVELVNGPQKVVFDKDALARFVLTTEVRMDRGWTPMFDGGRPLLAGEHFDLYPTAAKTVENSPERAAVLLSGTHQAPQYDWDVLVEARRGSPLIRFRVTCRLPAPLVLAGLEPQSMLWVKRPGAESALNQGPGNIYFGHAEKQWGNSFPAAWLWSEGREAAVFYNLGAMDWMSHRNLYRFHDCRAQAFSEGGMTGLGLRVVKRNFHELPAGDLVVEWHLYGGPRPLRPSQLEALDTLVRVFGELHPATAPWPENRIEPGRTDWRTFAEGTIGDLMLKDVTWTDVPVPGGIWRDGPPFPERAVSTLRVSSDYAVGSSCMPHLERKTVQQAWDFSCANNYLAPWIAIERLHRNADQRQFLGEKVKGLPLYYDPATRLIRHAPRDPAAADTGREMTWQHLTFALETVKVHHMLPPEEFDPAVAGKFLMATRGLMDLAHNVHYVFPQWFDPRKKTAIVQGDMPELGVIYEPWQAGTYAWLMCLAHEMTRDPVYLEEAKAALDKLFGGMTFTVKNARYSITYKDPIDFPITEIFGNAWAVAAAEKLGQRTGEAKWRRVADDCRNVLLRMTYWYESQVRDDPRDRFLHNAGLFRNHGGAMTGSPWETIEAYLALTVHLKHRGEPMDLLLRLFNLQRINSLYFYPAVVPDDLMACKELRDSRARYLPIEDFYMIEHGGRHGGMGRCVYMSSLALWNYLLYEALAEADAREVMVLNLDVADGFAAALAGADRNFLVYNPTDAERKCLLRVRALGEGTYRVAARSASAAPRETTHGSAELAAGIPLHLAAGQWTRLRVENTAKGNLAENIAREISTRDDLARAYQLLQEAARDGRGGADLSTLGAALLGAAADYRRRDVQRAADGAAKILQTLKAAR